MLRYIEAKETYKPEYGVNESWREEELGVVEERQSWKAFSLWREVGFRGWKHGSPL